MRHLRGAVNTSSRSSVVGRATLARARVLAAAVVVLLTVSELFLDPNALFWNNGYIGSMWQDAGFVASRIAFGLVTLIALLTGLTAAAGAAGGAIRSAATFAIAVVVVCLIVTLVNSQGSCVTQTCPSWMTGSIANWIAFYVAVFVSALLCRPASAMLRDLNRE